ncbi:hypothetical protein DACRYDRAFT_100008 [Dacryopinax primogenitus]|uniref:Uncharacterized protein n=1 Tax=Dacryopinax primogenitus (strain DJM 731) TaxID=1858805 RepID=M5FWS2_DACPD|nr:uncharacterized protein DACRYDRAFT_100008 [Dacryopinax primogenitus]EJU02406.1 hypothetical protein DACRYDRAFT_100008 [Dacryopinax primogenitus]
MPGKRQLRTPLSQSTIPGPTNAPVARTPPPAFGALLPMSPGLPPILPSYPFNTRPMNHLELVDMHSRTGVWGEWADPATYMPGENLMTATPRGQGTLRGSWRRTGMRGVTPRGCGGGRGRSGSESQLPTRGWTTQGARGALPSRPPQLVYAAPAHHPTIGPSTPTTSTPVGRGNTPSTPATPRPGPSLSGPSTSSSGPKAKNAPVVPHTPSTISATPMPATATVKLCPTFSLFSPSPTPGPRAVPSSSTAAPVQDTPLAPTTPMTLTTPMTPAATQPANAGLAHTGTFSLFSPSTSNPRNESSSALAIRPFAPRNAPVGSTPDCEWSTSLSTHLGDSKDSEDDPNPPPPPLGFHWQAGSAHHVLAPTQRALLAQQDTVIAVQSVMICQEEERVRDTQKELVHSKNVNAALPYENARLRQKAQAEEEELEGLRAMRRWIKGKGREGEEEK